MNADKQSNLSQLPVLFPIAAFVIALIGWTQRYGWDFIGHVPQIIVHSATIFIPSTANLADGNWLTLTAATMGSLSTMAGAVYLWIYSTGQSIDNFWTNLARRGHTIIIGDTDFAQNLQGMLSANGTFAIRVVPRPDQTAARRNERSRVLAIGYRVTAIAMGTGLYRATHVVIDLGSDVETLALAKRLISNLDAHAGARCQSVVLRICDNVYGAHFIDQVTAARKAAKPGTEIAQVTIFDDNSVGAEFVCARAKPYIRASKRGQARVHALIVGFSDAGEKLLEQVFLTSVAAGLETPRVTVIDRHGDARQGEFAARRPGVADGLAIEFVSLDVETDPLVGSSAGPAARRLQAIELDCPFTVIFLAEPTDGSHTRAGLLLLAHQKRNRLMRAPIFTVDRSDMTGPAQFFDTTLPVVEADEGACCLRMEDETVLMAALGNREIGKIARSWHETYRDANPSQAADSWWESLPESLRQANKRAAAHMPAMLWSMGLDDGAGGPPLAERLMRIDALTDLIDRTPDDPEIERLARLEHTRWMIERKLDGWRVGGERDDERKIHPQLVDWETLKTRPVEVAKDVKRLRDILVLARVISQCTA